MSINRVVISGNLTRDPELRRTQSGMAILGFGVAVNDRRRNQQTGEWEDYANFVDCAMFGQRAENVSQYLSKGSKVAIEGKLRWSQWEKDGQKRSKIEVVVDDLEFLSRGASRGQENQQDGNYHDAGQNTAPESISASQERARAAVMAGIRGEVIEPDPVSSVYDDDIPF